MLAQSPGVGRLGLQASTLNVAREGYGHKFANVQAFKFNVRHQNSLSKFVHRKDKQRLAQRCSEFQMLVGHLCPSSIFRLLSVAVNTEGAFAVQTTSAPNNERRAVDPYPAEASCHQRKTDRKAGSGQLLTGSCADRRGKHPLAPDGDNDHRPFDLSFNDRPFDTMRPTLCFPRNFAALWMLSCWLVVPSVYGTNLAQPRALVSF